MQAYVAPTDFRWFEYLASRHGADEVNFWMPNPWGGRFGVLRRGEPLPFKLKAPQGSRAKRTSIDGQRRWVKAFEPRARLSSYGLADHRAEAACHMGVRFSTVAATGIELLPDRASAVEP